MAAKTVAQSFKGPAMSVPGISQNFTIIDIDPSINTEGVTAAVALSNGHLALISSQYGSNTDVFLREFTLDGQAVTQQQLVNTTTFGQQNQAEAVQLANGNILVAWTDSSETAPDFNGKAVRFQLFDSAGQKIGAETVANFTTTNDQVLKSVLALDAGRFAVVWQGGAISTAPCFRIFNADGTPATSDVVMTNDLARGDGGHVAADGAGGLVAVGVTNTQGKVSITFHHFNAQGNETGAAVVSATGGNYNDLNLERLENGGYVVTWTDTSKTPPFNKGAVVHGQVLDANGAAVGAVFTVSDDIFSEHRQSVVTALPDGRFAVTWAVNAAGNTLNVDQVMRLFNADGTPASDILTVYDDTQDYPGLRLSLTNLQSVDLLPDGRLAYVFSALDPSGQKVLAATRIVDPRIGETVTLGDGNDTHTGTAYADFIGGGAGNDLLNGAGGDDTIYGGLGNDTLQGGAGNDVLYGSAGKNQLLGDEGNDRIYASAGGDFIGGGAGNDTIRGGDGADTIYAGLGDDDVGGGAGNDLIYGSAGANVIYAGLGNDTVQGGSGADTIYGSAGRNQLYGNDGNDVIYTSAAGDLAAGGAGNDSIYGGDGADTVYAGLGDDFIGGGAGNDLIVAGAGSNRMFGGIGNDTIVAGTGKDVMTGGPGADVFVFNTAASAGIGAGRDVITDFTHGVDDIDLRALHTSFNGTAGLVGGGTASFFYFADGGLLIGDQNGDGVADWVVELSGAPTITADDFLL
jgi:Ca2+-binding RTX toxin-like protein